MKCPSCGKHLNSVVEGKAILGVGVVCRDCADAYRQATEPERKKDKRKRVGVDIDGTLYLNKTKPHKDDSMPDAPVPGAIAWLEDITREYDVSINSSRCATAVGRRTVTDWLVKYLSSRAVSRITVKAEKDDCLLQVDDKGWQFDGKHFPSKEEIKAFRTWQGVK